MLRWIISSGELLDASGTVRGQGWAGHNAIDAHGNPVLGINNPACCNVRDIGPLPPGRYQIASMDSSKGPYTMHLEPLPNDGEKPAGDGNLPHMFGRSDFEIHGWAATNTFRSSDGCVCLGHDVRVWIWEQSGERELAVQPSR
jgi:hypothetical protein